MPEVMVSKCRIVTSCDIRVSSNPRSSTMPVSSARAPHSTSWSTAAAVCVLPTEAMRNLVSRRFETFHDRLAYLQQRTNKSPSSSDTRTTPENGSSWQTRSSSSPSSSRSWSLSSAINATGKRKRRLHRQPRRFRPQSLWIWVMRGMSRRSRSRWHPRACGCRWTGGH